MPKLALLGLVLAGSVIGILSLLPGSELPAQSLNDKLNHFIAYGVLAFLGALGRHQVSLFWATVLVIGYGLLLEALQGLMPFGRSASWLDAVANTAGAVCGILIALGVARLIAR